MWQVLRSAPGAQWRTRLGELIPEGTDTPGSTFWKAGRGRQEAKGSEGVTGECPMRRGRGFQAWWVAGPLRLFLRRETHIVGHLGSARSHPRDGPAGVAVSPAVLMRRLGFGEVKVPLWVALLRWEPRVVQAGQIDSCGRAEEGGERKEHQVKLLLEVLGVCRNGFPSSRDACKLSPLLPPAWEAKSSWRKLRALPTRQTLSGPPCREVPAASSLQWKVRAWVTQEGPGVGTDLGSNNSTTSCQPGEQGTWSPQP